VGRREGHDLAPALLEPQDRQMTSKGITGDLAPRATFVSCKRITGEPRRRTTGLGGRSEVAGVGVVQFLIVLLLTPLMSCAAGSACRTSGDLDSSLVRTDTLPSAGLVVENLTPGAPYPLAGWGLDHVAVLPGDAFVGDPVGVALDEWDRLFVLERGPAAVRVFAPNGELIRSIGRDGAGPMEFRDGMMDVGYGNVVVYDGNQGRILRFDTTGVPLRHWNVTCCGRGQVRVTSAQHVIVPVSLGPEDAARYAAILHTFDDRGVVVDTALLARPRGDESHFWQLRAGLDELPSLSTRVPLTPNVVWTVARNGLLLYGHSSTYAVTLTKTGADTVLHFTRTWERTNVDEAFRSTLRAGSIKAYERLVPRRVLEDLFRLEDIPSVYPAFAGLTQDPEGCFWIIGFHIGGATLLDRFNSKGRYLGTIEVHDEIPAPPRSAWGRDYFAAIGETTDGYPAVKVYRVQRPDVGASC
jgi:hypothetical protein